MHSTTETEQLEARLTEAFDALWDSFVDPREAFAGEEGDWWGPVGSGYARGSGGTLGPVNEGSLRDLREECRRLSITNEFAINGIENRISYVVGSGHTYQAVARRQASGENVDSAGEDIALRVQDLLDEFRHANRWHQRQQEVMRRLDRDGEALLRLFAAADGKTSVRFIEPDQVATPAGRSGDESATFGVLTRAGDVEAVQGYFVDGQLVDAVQVQHRKANVDSNVKRGIPLYMPVRSNLRRAEKLLRNMSVVAEIQSAIALIRKHRGATRTGVEQFVADNASGSTGSTNGRTRSLTHYGPGTILDAPAGLEYDFPATGIDAGSFVDILQAELRAIAARLVMPEFMFTSNASNANFASTMIAEGPAVRMFQRLQAAMVEDDCELLWRVIDNAMQAGRLPSDTRTLVELQITPPSLQIRDRLQEAQVDKIAFKHGVLSRQTWSRHLGLDYEQEQTNREVSR